jgi:hypothetical protein
MTSHYALLPEQASLESGLRVPGRARGGELRTQRAHPEALDREHVQERNKLIFIYVVSLDLAARKMAGLRNGMKTHLIQFHIQ